MRKALGSIPSVSKMVRMMSVATGAARGYTVKNGERGGGREGRGGEEGRGRGEKVRGCACVRRRTHAHPRTFHETPRFTKIIFFHVCGSVVAS